MLIPRRSESIYNGHFNRHRSHFALFPIGERQGNLGLALACLIRNPHGANVTRRSATVGTDFQLDPLGPGISAGELHFSNQASLPVPDPGECALTSTCRTHLGPNLSIRFAPDQVEWANADRKRTTEVDDRGHLRPVGKA